MKEVLYDVLQVQINSLKLLLEKEYNQDCLEVLKHYQYDENELRREVIVRISQLKDLYDEPLLLGALPDDELSIFRHILFQIEISYDLSYKEAIFSLWEVLFNIEEERSARIKLTINNIKRNGKENKTKPCRGKIIHFSQSKR